MATIKVSELTELTSAADGDLFLVADVSTNQSKKITKANLGISDENFTTALKTKLDGIETAADVTDATNVDAAGAVMNSDTSTASMSFVVDEDTMTSDSATKVPTQQSVKAYVDSQVQSKDALSELSGTLDDITDGTTYVKSTNDYTDAEQTKLSGIETGATADQTAQEIATAIDADATAETTLKSALGLGTAAYTASTDYATAAQGTTADSALQNVSEDTTPQLGGNLDTNGYHIEFGNGDRARFGDNIDLTIFSNGSQSRILESGSGNLQIGAGNFQLTNPDVTENMITANVDGAVTLYYDSSSKFATTSTGVDVTGNITTDTARSADVVDNDGSFDLDAGTNFTCTPTGNITLTFTNIPDGQSGTIVLVNTGGHTISAASTTKVMGADMLTTITTAGTYVIGYISDGTNVRVYNSLAQQ